MPNPDEKRPALVSTSTVVPQGDGSYIVKPGKPRQELTPAQFADAVGLHVNTIYVHIETGRIQNVRRSGLRKLLIDASELESWLENGRDEFLQG